MKTFLLSCFAVLILSATGCSSDRGTSTTTTEESSMVRQPAPSTTTQTTVEQH